MKRKGKQMNQTDSLLDALTAECKTPSDVEKLYSALLQRVINRGLQEEMTAHLGFEPHAKSPPGERRNSRNGISGKTVKGTFGELEVAIPRDRAGSFEPQW